MNPPFDSHVLLFLEMSESNVILPEEISSSQAKTESVIRAAGSDKALSVAPNVSLKKLLLRRVARLVRMVFRNSKLNEMTMCLT